MPDDRGMMRGDDSASVKDDDFTIESHSAPDAFADTPADTTTTAEPVTALVAEGDQDETPETPVEDETPDASQQSESQLGKAEAKAAETPKPKANKTPLTKRTTQLKHEVDALTHAKHKTKAELDAAERRLADLNREITAREAKPAEKAQAEPGKGETAPLAMPKVPNYRDYATDEEHEAALAKYYTDLDAYHIDQQTRLEQRITAGVESRFRSVGDDAAMQAAEERLVTTLESVRKDKADWQEKAEALKEITSSWYDPAAHKEATTPFLSDLAKSRLAMGLADGGELLYWLGSDPDRAQVVADLLPNRPIRDAIVHAPSVLPLLEYFATDEGQRAFEAMKQMHPLRVNQAIGALSVRLTGASSGSPAGAHPITKARPSARPPAGTPGARGSGGAPPGKQSFDDWMAEEDAKDLAKRKQLAGIAG